MEGAEQSERERWWRMVLAAGLTLWLAGFWFWSDASTHRLALFVLVLPGLVLNWRELREVVRGERWLWLVGVLLVYQWLSTFWSDPRINPGGYWLDVVMTGSFLLGVMAISRSPLVLRWVFPALGLLAALVALVSLLVFYAEPGRSVAEDRLRNVWVYEEGLNPVWTGLLCSFGALVAAWKATREGLGRWRWVWLGALVVLVLGLLASQSRGAMLAFGVGMGVLVVMERRRAVPSLVVCAMSGLAFFILLATVQSGSEAARDMIGRGTTGRFDIYGWFFKQMAELDGVIGKGMGAPASVPEEEFGWFVRHPHSVYLTQLYLTGVIGLGLLLTILTVALQWSFKLARAGEALWLALLGGGCVALVFDGSYVFSLHSMGRLEPLLLLLPATLAVGRGRGMKGEGLPL
ncbi:MAG: O-antigen ligase family protein [Verrucomicrobia bacterium]|nr:O-antigen ligase family protein [Verrucomicrobiota bacterium]MDA1005307.1 O-antigen ligase family protein [Verrucomicrobiota bacterium]